MCPLAPVMSASLWSAALDVSAPDHWLERVRQRIGTRLEAQPARRQARPAVWLGIFFVSLYLLTMGGHLDSPDEELMFQVTRSLAERGSLDVGDTGLAERLVLGGTDGRSYVPYSPVASAMSVPFYKVGQAIGVLLPARYADVAERFGVGLRDPLISAAACVLVYTFALELGFGTLVAVLLSLAFGIATFAWPFSKYSFSEPVTEFWLLMAVFAAVCAVRRRRPIGWSALSALALGLAIGSKATAGLALPALLVYLAAAGGGRVRTRLERSVPFVLVLMLPALGLALLNAARFGNPLDTGYHLENVLDLSHPVGIAGLLVSPAKSLFLYAPVALLGLLGFARLAARLPWEAGVFVWLLASHVVFHGLLVIWSGDAAWGPRYLLPALPFGVLPAGAPLAWTIGRLRRACWGAFGMLVGLGVLVNLGGVVVDQRVAFDILLDKAGGNVDRLDDLRWNPRLSPVLIHWQEFAERVGAVSAAWSQPATLVSGTYGKEAIEPVDVGTVPQPDLFPRWTSGAAVFELKTRRQPAELMLEYLDNRPGDLGPAVVHIVVDGTPLPESQITRVQSDVPLPDKRRPWFVQARLDDAVSGRDAVTVEIRSQTWQPARDTHASTDVRDLGIQIWDVRFQVGGQDVPLGEALLSPMPVSDARPWSYELMTWFYTPPWHLVDVWLWYLYLSGLPRWLLLLGLIPAAGVVWSARRLWPVLRSAC